MTMPAMTPAGMPVPQGQPVNVPMPPGMSAAGAAMPAQPHTAPIVIQDTGGIQYPPSAMPPVQPSGQPTQPVQGQPAQPAQPQAGQLGVQPPAGATVLGMETVLDGPSVPQEIRGWTFGRLLNAYGGLRDVALRYAAGAPGAPQAPATPAQPSQPSAPASAPQAGSQTPPAQGWNWANPADSIRQVVREVISAEVAPALAPIQQNAHLSQVAQARNQVAQEIGIQRFIAMESAIMQRLQGVDPAVLANPAIWRTAAEAAAGQAVLFGQPQGGQPQPPRTLPPQNVPQGGQPVPNLNGFWAEPSGGGAPVAAAGLNAREIELARAMNVPEESWLAWKNGIQSQQATQSGFGGPR